MTGPATGVALYAIAFVLIECIGALGLPVVAVDLHAVLIVVLLLEAALRPSDRSGAVNAAFAVVSLMRVLSLGMPFAGAAPPLRAAVVGVPLLLAVVLAFRLPGLSVSALGLRPRSWPVQGAVALTGIPLGVVVSLALPPDPAALGDGLAEVVTFGVVLVLFGGVLEELVFRGVLQQAVGPVVGRRAFLVSSAVFAAAYAGAGSAAGIGVAAGVGLLFGLTAQRTRSIVGVALAHGLLNVVAVLLWPRLLP